MLAVLRHRDFTLLWAANVVSMAGDWALLIALPVYVYTLTRSALATGASFAVYMAPRILLGPLAGVLADRWDRKRTMVAADLAQAAILLPLLAVDAPGRVWIVYLVTFAEAVAAQFCAPAEGALLPHLVPEDELVAANSLDSVMSGVARLAAPPLGGLLVATLGLGAAVVIDGASFLVSGVLIACIAASGRGAAERALAGGGIVAQWASLWRDCRDGLVVVVRRRVLAVVFVADGLANLEAGIVNVLLVVFVAKVLAGGAIQYGWATAAWGLGSLGGSVAMGLAGKRIPIASAYSAGLLALGAGVAAASAARSIVVAMPLLALAGFGMIGWLVSGRTLLQRGTSDAYRGRVLGAHSASCGILTLAGMAAASALGDLVGPAPLIALAGACALAGGLVAILLLRRTGPLEWSETTTTQLAAAGAASDIAPVR